MLLLVVKKRHGHLSSDNQDDITDKKEDNGRQENNLEVSFMKSSCLQVWSTLCHCILHYRDL